MSNQKLVVTALLGCLLAAHLSACSGYGWNIVPEKRSVNNAPVINGTEIIFSSGSHEFGEKLLQTDSIKKSSWFGKAKEEKTFSGDGISKITYIEVVGHKKKGDNGKVILVNGGPDSSFATLKFIETWSINCTVHIYGKYKY